MFEIERRGKKRLKRMTRVKSDDSVLHVMFTNTIKCALVYHELAEEGKIILKTVQWKA